MRTIFTIWTKPRETFEHLEKKDKDDLHLDLFILFYFGSLAIMIPRIANETKFLGDYGILFMIIAPLLSAFIGALFFDFVYSNIIWLFGRALQGEASRFQIQIVTAYFMVPGLISLFISLVLIVIAIIYKDISIIGYQNPLTQFIIWIFGIRIMIIGLAKFNKFSYGYALINLFIVFGLFKGILYAIKYLTH